MLPEDTAAAELCAQFAHFGKSAPSGDVPCDLTCIVPHNRSAAVRIAPSSTPPWPKLRAVVTAATEWADGRTQGGVVLEWAVLRDIQRFLPKAWCRSASPPSPCSARNSTESSRCPSVARWCTSAPRMTTSTPRRHVNPGAASAIASLRAVSRCSALTIRNDADVAALLALRVFLGCELGGVTSLVFGADVSPSVLKRPRPSPARSKVPEDGGGRSEASPKDTVLGVLLRCFPELEHIDAPTLEDPKLLWDVLAALRVSERRCDATAWPAVKSVRLKIPDEVAAKTAERYWFQKPRGRGWNRVLTDEVAGSPPPPWRPRNGSNHRKSFCHLAPTAFLWSMLRAVSSTTGSCHGASHGAGRIHPRAFLRHTEPHLEALTIAETKTVRPLLSDADVEAIVAFFGPSLRALTFEVCSGISLRALREIIPPECPGDVYRASMLAFAATGDCKGASNGMTLTQSRAFRRTFGREAKKPYTLTLDAAAASTPTLDLPIEGDCDSEPSVIPVSMSMPYDPMFRRAGCPHLTSLTFARGAGPFGYDEGTDAMRLLCSSPVLSRQLRQLTITRGWLGKTPVAMIAGRHINVDTGCPLPRSPTDSLLGLPQLTSLTLRSCLSTSGPGPCNLALLFRCNDELRRNLRSLDLDRDQGSPMFITRQCIAPPRFASAALLASPVFDARAVDAGLRHLRLGEASAEDYVEFLRAYPAIEALRVYWAVSNAVLTRPPEELCGVDRAWARRVFDAGDAWFADAPR